MKATIRFAAALIIIGACTVFFYSCQKDNNTTDSTAVLDNSMAQSESDKIDDAVNTAATDNDVNKLSGGRLMGYPILPSCATVTVDTVSDPHTITIDFGSTPCLCDEWDNKYRQGKIIASWTGHYRDLGTVIHTTTLDYYVGTSASQMNLHVFDKTVTNEGTNTNGNLHFAIYANGTITLYTGENITWTSTRDREWMEGEPTLTPLDDVYSITGAASGTDRNGNPFTVSITSGLRIALDCPWPESGTLQIDRTNLPTMTVDYGNGDCDDLATITTNGVTQTIHLW